jgi:hypothetical protein
MPGTWAAPLMLARMRREKGRTRDKKQEEEPAPLQKAQGCGIRPRGPMLDTGGPVSPHTQERRVGHPRERAGLKTGATPLRNRKKNPHPCENRKDAAHAGSNPPHARTACGGTRRVEHPASVPV